MKLIKCHASSFGKLIDFSYEFSDSINLINQENGFGKTTLAVFIKCMFYGITDGKRSIEENERKKYKPWNSLDRFGGYLVFEKEGKQYKIERFFGNKASEDSCYLTDLSTGKVYDNYDKIGEKLFGIDEEGFLSTIYFSQKNLSVKSNLSITSKFNEACDIQDTSEIDKAISKIKETASKYKYSGERGYINDAKREQNEIIRKIEQLKSDNESLVQLKDDCISLDKSIIDTKGEISNLQNELEKVLTIEANARNKITYDSFINEIKQKQTDIEQIKNNFNGLNVSYDELNNSKTCVNELELNKQKSQIAKQNLLELQGELDESDNKRANKFKPFLFIGSILFLIGLLLDFFAISSVFRIIGTCLTVVGALLSIFDFSKIIKNKKPKNNIFEDILSKNKAEVISYNQIITSYTESLQIFFDRFGLKGNDYAQMIETLKEALDKINLYQQNINTLNQQIKSLNFDASNLQENKVRSSEEVKNLIQQKNIILNNLISKKAQSDSYIKQKEQQLLDVDYLDNLLDENKQKIARLEDELSILNSTYKFMQKAEENLKIRYKDPILMAFSKYLSFISKEKTKGDIDIDFNVSIDENGSAKSTEYYSKGYRDLFDICKRFAVIDVLYTKEKPFIILDDPFTNLDNEKMTMALSLIKNLSNEYQILYFICHDSRKV